MCVDVDFLFFKGEQARWWRWRERQQPTKA